MEAQGISIYRLCVEIKKRKALYCREAGRGEFCLGKYYPKQKGETAKKRREVRQEVLSFAGDQYSNPRHNHQPICAPVFGLVNDLSGFFPPAIPGTGAALVAGTGAALVAGTGAALVAGTGAALVAGTGSALVAGTGAALVAGTGSALVAGSGNQKILLRKYYLNRNY
jgi:hypothetical protein